MICNLLRLYHCVLKFGPRYINHAIPRMLTIWLDLAPKCSLSEAYGVANRQSSSAKKSRKIAQQPQQQQSSWQLPHDPNRVTNWREGSGIKSKSISGNETILRPIGQILFLRFLCPNDLAHHSLRPYGLRPFEGIICHLLSLGYYYFLLFLLGNACRSDRPLPPPVHVALSVRFALRSGRGSIQALHRNL